MQKEEIKFQNSVVFEGMTSIRAIIKGRESGINDRVIDKVLYDRNQMRKIAKTIRYLEAVSDSLGFEVVESSAEEIDKITAKFEQQLEELNAWETVIDAQITTNSAELEEINAYLESYRSMLSSNVQEDFDFGLNG